MKIEKNAFVVLSYELRSGNAEGSLIEKTTPEAPLKFVYGAGYMLEMFEKKILGLSAGDEFSFTLKAPEAYGEVNPAAVVDIPKSIFVVGGELKEDLLVVGNHIPMMGANGQRLDGIVLEVADEHVKMDFNHPLAGEDLHFSGAIIEVREATAEELIGPSSSCGGGSCGGDCGGCGDNDGCGCGDDCDCDDDHGCGCGHNH